MAKAPKTIVLNSDYGKFRDEFLDTIRKTNTSQLVATWDLGDVYRAYVGDNSSYGKNIAEKLAVDLVDSGLFGTLESAKTMIYLSTRISGMFSRSKLVEYAARNMTVTHARALTTIKDEQLLGDVLERMFVTDETGRERVVSTTQFAEFIKERAVAIGADYAPRLGKVAESLVQADSVVVLDEDAPAETPDEELLSAAAPQMPSSGVTDKLQPTTPTTVEASKFEGGAEQGTAKDTSFTGSDGESYERTIESPLKTCKEFEKLATRLSVMCTDLVLAAEMADKDGFDTPKTEANFREAFELARSAGRDLTGPLAEALQHVAKFTFRDLAD